MLNFVMLSAYKGSLDKLWPGCTLSGHRHHADCPTVDSRQLSLKYISRATYVILAQLYDALDATYTGPPELDVAVLQTR